MSPADRALRTRPVLIALSLAALMLGLAMFLVVPDEAKAASHTKDIRGYAYDHAYRKMAGVSISVTVLNPGNPVTRTETTDSQGYFNVQFTATEWNQGRTVRVVATWGTEQTTNETLVLDNTYFQWENATAFSFEIPQFGTEAGLLTTVGIVGVVAAAVMVRRRR